MLSGERKTEQRVGIVAEICEHCLGITRHSVVAEVVVGYMYLVTIWRRELTRYAQCEICGNRSLRPAVFSRIVPNRAGRGKEIHQLIAETNPGIRFAANDLLDLWERLGSTAARQAYVARHFLAAQEHTAEVQLSRCRHLAFAAAATALTVSLFFCWEGRLAAALAWAPAILVLPAVVIAGGRWHIRRTLVRRCRQLLSSPATRFEVLEQTLAAHAQRYPLLDGIWPTLCSQVATDQSAATVPRAAPPHFLALAQVLDES